jgi:diadenosine tetraphosphate (Ap4A) HIT family hydrolase
VACALCRPELETPIVRQTDLWRTALNRNQNLLGKLIIVLRRHLEDVAGLTGDEWVDLHDGVAWTTAHLRRAFSPDHFNYAFLHNQDRHVHLHVIPRYAGNRTVGGATFSDPDYPAHYRVPGDQRIVDRELLEQIAAEIRG